MDLHPPNGNGKLLKIGIISSLLMAGGSFAKSTFFTGDEVGKMEYHLEYDDKELARLKDQLDRIEPTLNYFEGLTKREQGSVNQLQDIIDEQNLTIDSLRRELKALKEKEH